MARSAVNVTPGGGVQLQGYDNGGDGYVVQAVTLEPSTGGGATPYSLINTASANQDSTVIKASGGCLYEIGMSNNNAAVRYLKVYDKATAPTSADTPVLRYRINATTSSTPFRFSPAVKFSNGIAFRITGAIADNDTTAANASDHIVNAVYA